MLLKNDLVLEVINPNMYIHKTRYIRETKVPPSTVNMLFIQSNASVHYTLL